eukprot:TRINITY_DN6822_c0_g1_i14.p3 TRINITY_DN6822_c0_g1~~TRINITY_DN6822_c0_g1_i14.p3  ORF type:complete len:255 (+),score=-19.53 TRINITY_DN6822_c0_g1_i14:855-1619(+)
MFQLILKIVKQIKSITTKFTDNIQLICLLYCFFRPYQHQYLYSIHQNTKTRQALLCGYHNLAIDKRPNILQFQHILRTINTQKYTNKILRFSFNQHTQFSLINARKNPERKGKIENPPDLQIAQRSKIHREKKEKQQKPTEPTKSLQIQIVIVIANSTQANCQVFSKIIISFYFYKNVNSFNFLKKEHKMKDSLQFLITSKIKSNEKLDTQSTSNFSNRQNDSLQFLITSKIKSNEKLDTQPTSNFSNKSINPS